MPVSRDFCPSQNKQRTPYETCSFLCSVSLADHGVSLESESRSDLCEWMIVVLILHVDVRVCFEVIDE